MEKVSIFEIEDDQLFSPELWSCWRISERSRGLSFKESESKLSKFDSDIAYLRRATLLEYADCIDEALPYLKKCLVSTNTAIRCYAMATLVHSEARSRLETSTSELYQVHPAVDTLDECLRELRVGPQRDDFSLETEVIIFYNLCSLHSLLRNYQKSLQYAAEAIYLSLPLKATNLTSAARMSYALAATHLGRMEEAFSEYQKVSSIPVSNPRQKYYAALNCCGIHLMRGEDVSAQKIIDLIKESHPDDAPTQVTWQYARALSGLLNPEEEIAACPRSTYDVLNRALQLLMASSDPSRRDAANEILSLMRNWRPKSELHDATSAWIQTTALLHLDKPYLAAQRIHVAAPFYPLAELLVLGAKVEICLHHEGVELEPLGDLCRKVQVLFDRLPSQEARDGLAAKLTLWHPQAAAFVAMSPYSVYELVAAAMPSIFTDGRPIQVYGKTVTTHLPFVQISLEAFGIDASIVRDQSVERKRLAEALNVPWGTARRTLPVIPPTLLIYHYLRLAEKEGPLWRRAARELAHSHGMVPTTNGGHLRAQRATLEDALQRLLDAEIDAQQFSKMLQALHRRGRAA